MNQAGEVVGYTSSSNGPSQAFRSASNSPINLPNDYLGTLGGNSSMATAINSYGQVAGASDTAGGGMHAFLTAPEAPINPSTDDLGTLGGSTSWASGINDSGQATGWSGTSGGPNHAFLTEPNNPINPATDDIGALPFTPTTAQSNAGTTVNSAGVAAGFFTSTNCPNVCYPTAFVYQNGAITEVSSFARVPAGNQLTNINDSDQVADTGGCPDPSAMLPCIDLWQDGTMTSLAECDCETHALNNSLEVVGQAFRPYLHAFLLNSDGTLYDLNDLISSGSGWVLTDAVAVNDNGQIIGSGTLNGARHVYRLDPSFSAAARH